MRRAYWTFVQSCASFVHRRCGVLAGQRAAPPSRLKEWRGDQAPGTAACRAPP
jgi:hypothetical protein